jgi:shikimate 5-dehydrogenase
LCPDEGDVVRRLYFIGVSTARSSIMTIFPAWAAALGISAEMRGVDLPVDVSPVLLREALRDMAADPHAAGALITTHKAAAFDAAGDEFVELDPWALLCREVSCVTVRGGSLSGWAKDPITSRQAYTHLLGPEPWASGGGDVVCMGAGGAGLALTVAILGEATPPQRYVLLDKDPHRLDVAGSVLARLDVPGDVQLVEAREGGIVDELVSSAAAGSFLVNATGLGKDRPGAPISDGLQFPRNAVVWDMNYRGDLRFLEIARAQSKERDLVVADGWRYFLHGWTEVIAEVFGRPIDSETFGELDRIAEELTHRSTSRPASNSGISRA